MSVTFGTGAIVVASSLHMMTLIMAHCEFSLSLIATSGQKYMKPCASNVTRRCKMDKVIKLLEEAGFYRDGSIQTHGGKVARIAGNRFVGTHTSTRIRLRRGEQKVTVGKLTTSFYLIENRQAVGFVNFKTSNYEGIDAFVRQSAEAVRDE